MHGLDKIGSKAGATGSYPKFGKYNFFLLIFEKYNSHHFLTFGNFQVLYMMKMLHGAPYSFEYPIHVAIKNTDKALALFIIENMDVYLGKNSSGSNSIHLASEKGMVDIVAALKSLYVTPDSPNSDGKTPTQLAEINGHSEVIGILSPSTCTKTYLACRPSTSRKDGINDTDFDLGSFGKKKKKKRSISLENRINNDDSIANINIEAGIGEILTEPEPMDVD